MTIGNKWLRIVAAIIIVLAIVGTILYPRYERVRISSSFFSGVEQYENLGRLYEVFPHKRMEASAHPQSFSYGAAVELPQGFVYESTFWGVEAFLNRTDTVALLVLKNGEIIHEQYRLTGGADVAWMSMSVSKSYLAALIGIAVDEGDIKSITQPITDYVPSLAGSGFAGVRIKDVLQMSSGAQWNENFSDPNSDINRFGRIFALGGSLDEFVATVKGGAHPPGTYSKYNSMNTQALAMMLSRATGMSVTDYMREKLWHPLGAEDTGYWLVDSDNVEMAFGAFNATARDYAKIGQLYLQRGKWHGKQIVPAAWIDASVTPDAPHLLAGKDNPFSNFELGYGYQWWVPEGDRGEFLAIGAYNQYIYVAPRDNIVIVKLSANSTFGTTSDESGKLDMETIELFRAIVSDNAD
ncbi:MAG: serine hydrolase [Alphaproteobacteria bacterium]|nr:serine hydrolase [Alphaproteobacteria bacterium]